MKTALTYLLTYLLKSAFGLPLYTYLAWTNRVSVRVQSTLLQSTAVTWGLLILLGIACLRHPPEVDGRPLYLVFILLFVFGGWLAHMAATPPPSSARS